ncbi:HAD-IA family hydrolase [Anoxynatronum sibiricum]|uniref:HAD-IA family hydrolase n=1 Tax=Anoxynatronum sibiricum TaxID=210623 RepID=A0ABU9VTV1_9CLOT
MEKHLLFDFDGTLVDSLGIGLQAMNTIGHRKGYPRVNSEDLDALLRKPIRERFRHYGVPMVKLPALALEFYREYKKGLQELRFFEGIPDMLHRLHEAGCCLTVISSNDPEIIKNYMVHHNMNLFHKIIGSNRIFGKDKIIRRYMKQEKLAPEQLIYVGDELRDIEACKRAGIPIIWVSYGFDHEELVKAAGPEFVAHSPAEVVSIINGLEHTLLK